MKRAPHVWMRDKVRALRTATKLKERFWGSTLVALGAGVVFFLLLLLVPDEYESESILLVSSSTKSATTGLAALAASQLGLGATTGDVTTPQFVVLAVATNAVLDEVLNRPYRRTDSTWSSLGAYIAEDTAGLRAKPRKVRKDLEDRVELLADLRAPVLTLTVTDDDPRGAQDIAAGIIDALQKFLLTNRISNSRDQREYLERELANARTRLAEQEQALEDFLARNRSYASSPGLNLDLNRLRRRLDQATQVEAGLVTQLQTAYLDEARDTPALTIIDAPEVPRKPVGPKRGTFTVLFVLLTGAISLFYFMMKARFKYWLG
jgi:uncharacterized protein involved in exopolysaccharide biosynthesis